MAIDTIQYDAISFHLPTFHNQYILKQIAFKTLWAVRLFRSKLSPSEAVGANGERELMSQLTD